MLRKAISAASFVACGALALASTSGAAHRDAAPSPGGAAPVAAHVVRSVDGPPRLTHYRFRWSRQTRATRAFTSSGAGPGDDAVVVGLAPGATAAGVALRYRLELVAADARIRAAKLTGDRDHVLALARAAGRDTALRYVEQDRSVELAHRRDDPATTQVDPATGVPFEWTFAQVGLDHALNLSRGNADVLVGVVDSGVTAVPDLTGKIAGSWYFRNEATDATDTEGHGTFVSSIIAGNNDDRFGLAGFCGSCRLDVFKSVYTTDFTLAISVRRLVDDHVHIINLSLGREGSPSYVLADALSYAIASGVLVVASSGNDNAAAVATPAEYLQPANGASSYGLAVGASDATGARAWFSNWGSHLSLLAPGTYNASCSVGIWAALPPVSNEFDSPGACARTFADGGVGSRYAYASGTSFSAPEVAGVAALVWAARPELKNYEVANILKQSATRPAGTGWQPDRGWGVLNAARALELATGRSSADQVVLGAAHLDSAPRAGKQFTIHVAARWQDGMAVDSGSAHCTAAVGGRRIASVDGVLEAGSAACSYRIPSWAARRRMTISVSARDAAGNGVDRSLAFSVRK
jgi:subtilisin family serine protease